MAILKADPDYRRNVLLLLVALAVIGFAAIQWGLPKLLAYIEEKEPMEGIRFIRALLIVVFASALPMAFYMYRFGRRILRSGQFPPPGTRVIRDTEIIEGGAARRKGRLLIVASIFMASAALAGMLYVPYLLGKIVKQLDAIQEHSPDYSPPRRGGRGE